MSVDITQIKGPFAKMPPSGMFLDIIVDGGHIVADCEFCGRTFFEDDEHAGDWNAGELEALRNKAKADPDRYVAMDVVRSGVINGKTGIVGCPCNWAKPYEDLFWGHRRVIMQFISAKVKDIVERAMEDESAAEQATADLVQAEKAQETVRCPKCLKFVSLIAMNEGGICIKCWEKAEQEAKEETARQNEWDRQKAKEEADKRAAAVSPDDSGDDLPF